MAVKIENGKADLASQGMPNLMVPDMILKRLQLVEISPDLQTGALRTMLSAHRQIRNDIASHQCIPNEQTTGHKLSS